ncbi:aromatic amino acid lyase [Desulfosporosinus meridiei]|uniref:aromatic amino acid lyase n=1 Tax=Desulfosporosinus meridiei TaxID=79209 RepID=UPI0002E9507F|nr:aromatic amino acid lyase [Desulfosporosinus meridiei]
MPITVLTEMNSCCDNPLIFSDEDDGQVLMGCNADGSFVGIEADSLCMAMTMMAKMSERRTHRLVNLFNIYKWMSKYCDDAPTMVGYSLIL